MFARRSSRQGRGPATGPAPRRGWIGEDGRYLAKHALAAIGTFVMLTGFLSILTSKSLRHLVQDHSYPIFIAFVVTSLSTLIAANYASLLRGRYRKLELATEKSDSLKDRSSAAHALLCLLACFAHAPVDMNMLQTVHALALTSEFQRILTHPDYLKQAADELSRMSLAEIDLTRKLVRLQRTAQIFTRGQLWMEDPETALALEKQVQSMLAASDPGAPDRDDTEEGYLRSRQHLIATGAYRSADPAVRQLIINQLRRLYRAGAYAEGVTLGETSLRNWQGVSGGNDRETLALAVEIGTLMWRIGRWKEARTLNNETLERLRSRFGTDDHVYLLCARNHGIDLALLGDYQAALENDLALLSSFDRVSVPMTSRRFSSVITSPSACAASAGLAKPCAMTRTRTPCAGASSGTRTRAR